MPNHFRSTELVAEFNGPLNQNFLFKPLMEILRGRWMVRRVKLADTGKLSAMPDLPGQYIAIDVKAKTYRVVDPLGFPENEDVLQAANAIRDATNIGGGKAKPRPEIVKQNVKDSDMKSLLWQVLELFESGDLTVVQGTMPSRKQVLEMPGALKLRYATMNQKTDKMATEEELRDLDEQYGITRPDLQKA